MLDPINTYVLKPNIFSDQREFVECRSLHHTVMAEITCTRNFYENSLKDPLCVDRFLYGHTARMYGKSEHMNTLAQLICSRVRAEIFRILFRPGSGGVHLREIQRQSGFAIGTVRQDIEKLAKLGVVIKRRDGNRVYYMANEDHPLYNEISKLVLKTVGMVDTLVSALSMDEILCAFVFGSMASGTAGPNSDIDLMVIGKIGLRKLSSFLSGAGNQLGREINPHVMSPAEFQNRLREKDHFLTSVLASPKIFVIGAEHDLKAMG